MIEELDQVREDQAAWSAEREEWAHKMTRLERDVQKRISAVDTWQHENEVASVRQDLKSFRQEQRVVNSQVVSVETMRDHLEDVRAEMGYAQSAVSEARLALAEAERREVGRCKLTPG